MRTIMSKIPQKGAKANDSFTPWQCDRLIIIHDIPTGLSLAVKKKKEKSHSPTLDQLKAQEENPSLLNQFDQSHLHVWMCHTVNPGMEDLIINFLIPNPSCVQSHNLANLPC